ncbi:MAG: 2-dehydro-3-deoxygalactonokinase [Pseudomonadota bacterium]
MPSEDGVPALSAEALSHVAVDWGTSRLRAWAIDWHGEVLGSVASDAGMGGLQPSDFPVALDEAIGAWLTVRPGVPVLCCGMVGARGGWQEVPYRAVGQAPLVVNELADIGQLNGSPVRVVPGLAQRTPADIMRGEETQVAGLVASGITDALVCLPGSHSKWVTVLGGCVAAFTTALTGEAFAAFRHHTVLRLTVSRADAFDSPAFEAAVQEALDDPRQVLTALFRLRAEALLNGLGADAAQARLSGWLIGVEIGSVVSSCRQHGTVHLVGERKLARRYARALALIEVASVVHDPTDCVLAGLALARQTNEE